MTKSFAHSERAVKTVDRHLRRELDQPPVYVPDMRLRVKELRESRRLTVAQLAEMAGMSPSYLSEIENHRKTANARRLQQLADALGVSVFALIDDKSMDTALLDHLQTLQALTGEDRAAVIRHALSLSGAARQGTQQEQ
jgi:transcriptional regulator with XRE-family HTH domain